MEWQNIHNHYMTLYNLLSDELYHSYIKGENDTINEDTALFPDTQAKVATNYTLLLSIYE